MPERAVDRFLHNWQLLAAAVVVGFNALAGRGSIPTCSRKVPADGSW